MPNRYAPYAVLASLIALMALIAWLGIAPARSAIVGRMDELQKLYTLRENRDRQVARLPELEEQFQEIIAGEEAMGILLSEDRIVDFVKTLEGLAGEEGVTVSIESKESAAIIEKKPLPKTAAKKPETSSDDAGDAPAPAKGAKPSGITDTLPFDRYLHINVSVKGEYADIVEFLHRMETLPFALDVIALDVRINDDEEADISVPVGNPFAAGPGRGFSAASDGSAQKEGIRHPEPVIADIDTAVYIRK